MIPSSVDQCGAHVMPLLYKGAQEVITVHNTSGLALHGNPSDAHSWFPGYDPYPSNMSSVFSFIA
mgnify:CR=1 FL=1